MYNVYTIERSVIRVNGLAVATKLTENDSALI